MLMGHKSTSTEMYTIFRLSINCCCKRKLTYKSFTSTDNSLRYLSILKLYFIILSGKNNNCIFTAKFNKSIPTTVMAANKNFWFNIVMLNLQTLNFINILNLSVSHLYLSIKFLSDNQFYCSGIYLFVYTTNFAKLF